MAKAAATPDPDRGPRQARRTCAGQLFSATVAASVLFGFAPPASAQLKVIVNGREIGQMPPELIVPVDAPTSFDETDLSEVIVEKRITDLVAELDSADYARREAVTAELLGPAIDLIQMQALLSRQGLSAEQRYRLLEIVRDRLIHTPRGALGISMNWQQEILGRPGEIEVSALVEGMPAREVLKVGDRIAAIDGRPLRTSGELIQLVQNRMPGERVRLTVHRPRDEEAAAGPAGGAGQPAPRRTFETIEVDLTLGSADKLARVGGPDFSPVLAQRRSIAADMQSRYSPAARSITLPESALVVQRPSADSNVPFVDDEPVIQSLLNDLRLIESGQRITPERKAVWRSTLRALEVQWRQPELSAIDRDYLRRLAQRYAELIPQ